MRMQSLKQLIKEDLFLWSAAFILLFTSSLLVWHFTESTVNTRGCAAYAEKDKEKCWTDVVAHDLEEYGIDASLARLGNLYAAGQFSGGECHDISHIIGQKAYYIFARTGQAEVTAKASYCGYGVYHGFMETLLRVSGDFQEARDFCTYVAEHSPNQYHAEDACYHGVGHGVVDGSDLRAEGDAKAIISPGFTMCERIALTSDKLKSCATGIFNSLVIMEINKEHGLSPNREDPYGFCEGQPKPEYVRACYEQMNALVSYISNRDFPRALQFATAILDERESLFAVRSLAADLAVALIDAGGEDEDAIRSCQQLQGNARLWCIDGFVGGLMEHGEPKKEYVRADQFCAAGILTDEERQRCYTNLFSNIQGLYTTADVTTACAVIREKRGEVLTKTCFTQKGG